MDKEVRLGMLAITATLERIVELSIAQQEGRITAADFADTTARVLAESAPYIPPLAVP